MAACLAFLLLLGVQYCAFRFQTTANLENLVPKPYKITDA